MKKPLLLKSSPRLRIEFSKGCIRSVFVRQTTHSLLPRPANEKISRCNSISPFRSPLRERALLLHSRRIDPKKEPSNDPRIEGADENEGRRALKEHLRFDTLGCRKPTSIGRGTEGERGRTM